VRDEKFYRKQIADPAYVELDGYYFIRIPKCASRALVAAGKRKKNPGRPLVAIIRHPVDRLISTFLHKSYWTKVHTLSSFEQFVDDVIHADRDTVDIHVRAQVKQLIPYPDYLIALDDLDKAFETLGIGYMKRVNANERKKLAVSPGLERAICKHYREDLFLYESICENGGLFYRKRPE